MGDAADAGKLRARGSRVRAALPVVAVETREDWAVLLAKHNRLLRDYARHYLGDAAPEEDVEDTVERTVDLLLAVEDPAFDHALRYATQAVWRECQRTARRRELERTPVDRRLGPLTGRVARVLEQLGPRQRQTLMLAAQGLSPSDIARVDKSTAAAVRVRLYRARERVSELLQEGGVSAFLLFVPRRMKRAAVRSGHVVARVADGVGGQAFATGALVPVLACTVLSSTPVPATVAVAPMRAVAVAPVPHGAVAATITGSAAVAAAPQPGGSRPTRATAPTAPPASQLDVTTVAAALPFDIGFTLPDVQLTTLARTPRLQGIGPVIGAGTDRKCGCSVLVQSLDGGKTWTSRPLRATESPFSQLTLPPDYPRDPRIFASSPGVLGIPSAMARGFDQPFQVLTSLPPGFIYTSAHFDDGDPRLFSVGLNGIWSSRMTDRAVAAPQEEIDYSYGAQQESNAFAKVATPPPTASAPAIVAWVPALSTIPRTGQVALAGASSLAKCAVSGPCELGAALPIAPPLRLIATRTMVVALGSATGFVSHDFGITASPGDVPVGQGDAVIDMAETLPDSTLWARVSLAKGALKLMRSTAGGWVDVADPLVRDHGGVPATLDDRHIWTTLDDGRVRCVLISDGRWLPRCPA
ncbi:MAG TPA: sigma factor-like helix-turn-helix DNA-binding protein [Candidatus Dormibacteraeota bacterium]|jgi:DNA-directed RNA polymerase specialized sigma24 family protein|nr:sigma factor-like helix-turn-helix DNA-binding protein [Candidatus Dormibacteraeota bacterium]